MTLATAREHLLGRFRHGRRADPAAALFSRLRLRLTLWYSAVLTGALLLSGAALYLSARQMLLRPIDV